LGIGVCARFYRIEYFSILQNVIICKMVITVTAEAFAMEKTLLYSGAFGIGFGGTAAVTPQVNVRCEGPQQHLSITGPIN
jgi:hypothetical protein